LNEVVDIWRQYGFSSKDNADSIIREVELNVFQLIEKITAEEPGILVQAGRKSAHLISHYKISLDESGFLTCLFRAIGAELSETSPGIEEGSSIYIVSDSIHTGTEIRNMIIHFRKKSVVSDKIFCYLLNNDGFLNILEEGLIEKEKVAFLFSSSSEEEYSREINKLQVFFRNRIEPMEPDVCFNKYNINMILDTEYLLKILTPFNQYVEECNMSVEISEDRGLSSKIKELKITIDYCDFLKDIFYMTFKNTYDCEINGVSIRFKINQRTIDSDFTVIIKSEGTCNARKNIDYTHCLDDEAKCLLKKAKYPEGKEIEAKTILCPRCLDLWFSSKILDFLDERISEEFSIESHECTRTREYRPFF